MTNNTNFFNVLKKFRDKLLKAQDDDRDWMDVQDYGLNEEDLEGLSTTDEPNGKEDETDKWIKEHEKDAAVQEEDQQEDTPVEEDQQEEDQPDKEESRSKYYKQWKPRNNYSDEQNDLIQSHVDQGYNEREAEDFAGARQLTSHDEAYHSRVEPTQPSDKHLAELKEIAKQINSKRRELDFAEAEKNADPLKHARGQADQKYKDATKDYHGARNEFRESDEYKGMNRFEKVKALKDWEKNFHSENPDYTQNVGEVDINKEFREAGSVGGGAMTPASYKLAQQKQQLMGSDKHQAMGEDDQASALDKLEEDFHAGEKVKAEEKGETYDPESIKTVAGQSGVMGDNIRGYIERMAGMGSGEGMSAEAAAQHVGGVATDQGTQAATVQDPLMGGRITSQQRAAAVKMMDKWKGGSRTDVLNNLITKRTILRRAGSDTMTPTKNQGESEGEG